MYSADINGDNAGVKAGADETQDLDVEDLLADLVGDGDAEEDEATVDLLQLMAQPIAAAAPRRPPRVSSTVESSAAGGEVCVDDGGGYEDLWGALVENWPMRPEHSEAGHREAASVVLLGGSSVDAGGADAPEAVATRAASLTDDLPWPRCPPPEEDIRTLRPSKRRRSAAVLALAPLSPPRSSPPPAEEATSCPQAPAPLASAEHKEEALILRSRGSGSQPQMWNPPPPEAVMAAFATLDLGFSATVRDVHRQARQCARRVHPDKASAADRRYAVREFRLVQDAKEVALAWLRDCWAPGDESDDSVPCCGFGSGSELEDIGGGAFLGRQGSEGGSVSEDSMGDTDDLRACGVRHCRGEDGADGEDTYHVGGRAGEDESSSGGAGSQRLEGGELAVAAGWVVRTGEGAVEQAVALSRHFANRTRRRACGECLEREVSEGSDVCRRCLASQRRLLRQLEMGLA